MYNGNDHGGATKHSDPQRQQIKTANKAKALPKQEKRKSKVKRSSR